MVIWSFPGGSDGKESACSAGDPGSIPGLGRSPGEGNSLPTPGFLPGGFHGQGSLVGYSPVQAEKKKKKTWVVHLYSQCQITLGAMG